MIKQKDNFLIRYEKEDEDFLEDINLIEIYSEVKSFFNFPSDIMIRVNFVYSPEEFMFFTGRKEIEDWIVGQTSYFNSIIIFAPSVVEKFTSHERKEIKGIIAHEIAHLFYGNLKFVNLPLINEGIATFFKYQFIDFEQPFSFTGEEYPIRETKNYRENYIAGYQLIKKIVETENSERLIEFLKEVKQEDSDKILYEKFREILGKSPLEFIKLKGGKI